MSQPATGGATRADLPPPEQLGTLVGGEVRLAQAEIMQKAKRFGTGAGLFGGAGLVAVLGLNALVTAVVRLLTETIASVEPDVETVKQGVSR